MQDLCLGNVSKTDKNSYLGYHQGLFHTYYLRLVSKITDIYPQYMLHKIAISLLLLYCLIWKCLSCQFLPWSSPDTDYFIGEEAEKKFQHFSINQRDRGRNNFYDLKIDNDKLGLSCAKLRQASLLSLYEVSLKKLYQPSGAGGTRSPPATPNCPLNPKWPTGSSETFFIMHLN